ncbi:contractile injection system protein, VgrG/Pvc8 family [Sphingosinicella sp. CPCC 101087]|uniref:contractile injection system protein, VgrG/Pvc8 family n=1 Tax=Sphingosinicella sp. CPCC 101087 TaxID=2497754 RepID=UPI00101BB5FE|nr:contractile injection system protein, VgrG/Pvc8 family [Sphingosinicella sp. CPCC 101087]
MPEANIPGFRVTLDGRDLTEAIAPRLISLSVSEKRGGEADQLDLTIHDHDGAMAIPREGARLQVSLGWTSATSDSGLPVGLVDKGSFKVDEADWGGPPDLITIRARSADLTAGYRQRRERRHRDTTIGAIVQQVAGANGLQPHVAPDLASIAVPVLSQDQVSDMALIRRLGRRHDAVAQIRDGRLIFMPIGAGVTPGGREIPAAALTKRDGDKYSFRRVERGKYNKVEARWHSQAGAKRETVSAEVGGPAGGSGGRDRGTRRIRRVYATEAEAREAARAEARRIIRAAAEFEITLAYGRPDLYPERPMTLAGFKPEIDTKSWLIAEVTHSLDSASGLRTRLKLETRS